MPGPSHQDKPPKQHDLVIDEETATSLLRESRSGNQMCALNMEEAGITEQDLETQLDIANYYKQKQMKQQGNHVIPQDMLEDMEQIDDGCESDNTVVISDSE